MLDYKVLKYYRKIKRFFLYTNAHRIYTIIKNIINYEVYYVQNGPGGVAVNS